MPQYWLNLNNWIPLKLLGIFPRRNLIIDIQLHSSTYPQQQTLHVLMIIISLIFTRALISASFAQQIPSPKAFITFPINSLVCCSNPNAWPQRFSFVSFFFFLSFYILKWVFQKVKLARTFNHAVLIGFCKKISFFLLMIIGFFKNYGKRYRIFTRGSESPTDPDFSQWTSLTVCCLSTWGKEWVWDSINLLSLHCNSTEPRAIQAIS